MEITISSMIGGQPKREKKGLAETSNRFYHLGRRAAALENERNEIDKNFQVNNVQQLMINQATMQLMQVLNEVTMRQKALDMQMQMMSAPPPLPGSVPPPLPQGDMQQGMPPIEMPQGDMGGMPPMGQEGVPPQDMGGIPPGAPQEMPPMDTGGAPPGIPADQVPLM